MQHKQQYTHHVPQQPHRQTKDDHMTTDTTEGHRPSSKSEINLIILQVNINGIKNKLEELGLLIHDIHAYITIQETKLTPKAKTPKVHNIRRANTCDPALKLLNEEINFRHTKNTNKTYERNT